MKTDHSDAQPTPFGQWLLQQRDGGDWVTGIADAARVNRTLPQG